jgi:hypothetical protein
MSFQPFHGICHRGLSLLSRGRARARVHAEPLAVHPCCALHRMRLWQADRRRTCAALASGRSEAAAEEGCRAVAMRTRLPRAPHTAGVKRSRCGYENVTRASRASKATPADAAAAISFAYTLRTGSFCQLIQRFTRPDRRQTGLNKSAPACQVQ